MYGNHIYNLYHFKSLLKVNLLNFKKYMSCNTFLRIFPYDWLWLYHINLEIRKHVGPINTDYNNTCMEQCPTSV